MTVLVPELNSKPLRGYTITLKLGPKNSKQFLLGRKPLSYVSMIEFIQLEIIWY